MLFQNVWLPSSAMPQLRQGQQCNGIYWREISRDLFSSWDFQNFQIPGEFLSISPHLVGFIKICPDPTLSISWDLQTKIINRPNFYSLFCWNQVSPGILVIFKMVRVSPQFSSSRGIPRDGEMFSWRGGVWSGIFKMARVSHHFSSSRGIQLDLSRPYPLHENLSPSRGIYRLNLSIDLSFHHCLRPTDWMFKDLLTFVKLCPSPS